MSDDDEGKVIVAIVLVAVIVLLGMLQATGMR